MALSGRVSRFVRDTVSWKNIIDECNSSKDIICDILLQLSEISEEWGGE